MDRRPLGADDRGYELPAFDPVRAGRAIDLKRNRNLGLAAICLGFLMITLDATIVNVALGPVVSDLGGSLHQRSGSSTATPSPLLPCC